MSTRRYCNFDAFISVGSSIIIVYFIDKNFGLSKLEKRKGDNNYNDVVFFHKIEFGYKIASKNVPNL